VIRDIIPATEKANFSGVSKILTSISFAGITGDEGEVF
jgi:hypothetical protein